jgi:excisionase family DNA binding protein
MPNVVLPESLSDRPYAHPSLFDDPYARLLTKPEIAKYFNKSTRWVEDMMKQRAIPYIRIGGHPRFRLRDVERALEKFTVREVSL